MIPFLVQGLRSVKKPYFHWGFDGVARKPLLGKGFRNFKQKEVKKQSKSLKPLLGMGFPPFKNGAVTLFSKTLFAK